MAKQFNYDEELLLSAVNQFAMKFTGKIKATKLAEWCHENVEGLEQVHDYDFQRKIKVKNPKTGKETYELRECTKRINEINVARSQITVIKKNPILNSVSIDDVIRMPQGELAEQIKEARRVVQENEKEIFSKRIENNALKAENKKLRKDLEELTEKVKTDQKSLGTLERIVKMLSSKVSEQEQKEVLKSFGIEDGGLNLEKYLNSVTEKESTTLDICAAIRKFAIENPIAVEEQKTEKITTLEEDLGGWLN